jgi:hypothetical protein
MKTFQGQQQVCVAPPLIPSNGIPSFYHYTKDLFGTFFVSKEWGEKSLKIFPHKLFPT